MARYVYSQESGTTFKVNTTDKCDAYEDTNEVRQILNDLGELLGHSKFDDSYPKDATAGGTIYIKKSKLDATSAPTVNNDTTEGYEVGSIWCDVTADKGYVCLDKTDGAAVWTEITAGGGLAAADIDTSAKLAAIVTDEIGTGKLIFAPQGVILGDATAGRVLRQIYVNIEDGTDANTIKATTGSKWNGDANAVVDNIAKGATTGVWSLSANGAILILLNTGVSGDAVAIFADKISYNDTGTALPILVTAISGGLSFTFLNATTGAVVDLTTYLTAGKLFQLYITYLTSA